ncbi:MAG: hypothetical protein MZV65_33945 [Chromatiales bacterium]|nr:hypothetical protein [Chromatiales bacterium]
MLRVLGNLLGLDGFELPELPSEVRADVPRAQGMSARLITPRQFAPPAPANGARCVSREVADLRRRPDRAARRGAAAHPRQPGRADPHERP